MENLDHSLLKPELTKPWFFFTVVFERSEAYCPFKDGTVAHKDGNFF